ncbi:MAG: hypothetical protein HPY53_12220 [Brevinematales bacterium]|nr:hypothetical protein [Brevinematales bacterium]
MKKIMIVPFILFLFYGVSLAKDQNDPVTAIQPEGKYFTVWFEQFGQIVPVKNHLIKLQKKPFKICIAFTGTKAVLANFNLDPFIYDGFFRKKPIWNIIQPVAQFMGVAEYDKNPNKDIMLTGKNAQYLYYETADDNRFNETEETGDGIICKRWVENIFASADEVIPIGKFVGDTLFAIFLYASPLYEDNPVEYQKEYFKIQFVK